MNKSKKDAIQFIFKNYYQQILNDLNKITDNYYDAEDIISEMFLDFLYYKPAREINYNNLLSACMARAKLNLSTASKHMNNTFSVISTNPEEILINIEKRKTLESEIYNFKKTYNRVLELYYLKDMRPCQIAKELCIKRNTATRKVSRGSTLLKKHLIKKGYR